MAYSYVRYTGNGSTTNYTFSFPTISTDHIKVRVNGTLVTNWSFLSASTIQFAAAPANAAIIEIRRETPKDSSIVNFTDGSVLLEAVLVQARQEGQLVAGRGGIEDGLRVVARLDLVFGREQGGREQEGEEAHGSEGVGIGVGVVGEGYR